MLMLPFQPSLFNPNMVFKSFYTSADILTNKVVDNIRSLTIGYHSYAVHLGAFYGHVIALQMLIFHVTNESNATYSKKKKERGQSGKEGSGFFMN